MTCQRSAPLKSSGKALAAFAGGTDTTLPTICDLIGQENQKCLQAVGKQGHWAWHPRSVSPGAVLLDPRGTS